MKKNEIIAFYSAVLTLYLIGLALSQYYCYCIGEDLYIGNKLLLHSDSDLWCEFELEKMMRSEEWRYECIGNRIEKALK